MKRIVLAFVLLIGMSFSTIPPQRLVVLPSSSGAAENLLQSFCIDVFRSAPGKDAKYSGGFTAKSYSEVLYEGDGDLSATHYLGESEDDAVPGYYKAFINDKVAVYKGRRLTYDEAKQTQTDIWAFNALDVLGYIKNHSGNLHEEYDKAAEAFKFNFGIADEDASSRIVRKARQLYYKRGADILSPAEVRLFEDGISFQLEGQAHQIEISYDGVSFDDIEIYSEEIKADLNKYIKLHGSAPDGADISKESLNQYYLLTFNAEWEDPMYFALGNNHATRNDFMDFPENISKVYAKTKSCHLFPSLN